ncbi:MAG: transglycosylase domain-containing protein [Candidatus Limnocylindria bacterium]
MPRTSAYQPLAGTRRLSPALRLIAMRAAERRRRRPGPARRLGRLVGGMVAGAVSMTAVASVLVVVIGASVVNVVSAGLPEPTTLADLRFAQPTIVYDRDGTVELGRLQRERREVVRFDDIPPLVLDATTTAEDRTFWDNAGVDMKAVLAAVVENAAGERERGASTITQQLVRARLLPEDAVAPGSDRYVRKVMEIIQSLRLTDTFPGEDGKRTIITAYLNEIFYGHDAYGIAAAAHTYFGANLRDLTVAQAALLAALPQSPSTLDPYADAERDEEGRLVVPRDAPAVVRRDWILRSLVSSGRWTSLSGKELQAALAEPVVLAGEPIERIRGGHLFWQVRRQLTTLLPDVDLETSGYRVITTVDWRAQRIAEKWVAATAIAPTLSAQQTAAMLKRLKIGSADRRWITALRGKDLHNGALVAMDYRTGDVLAYVGSAGYARNDLEGPRFSPKFDAAGDGARQPGSAFKPIVYAAAFEARRLTPGSLLLDVTTEFDRASAWAPRDADRLDRGPVRVRQALQYSLNVPAIRALERIGLERVADTAAAMGLDFAGGRDAFLRSGLAGALGTVETTPLDLTAAYATLGNGGVRMAPRMILEVRAADGSVVWRAPDPEGERALSAQTAFLVTDILAGNTDPRENPIWAERLRIVTKDGTRRPAAVKTGTTNDARDLGTYGYLAPQPDGGPGLAVGVWLGNSDHSMPRTKDPATSLTAAAPLWRAFVADLTSGWAVTDFKRPKDVVSATIDAWSGGRPGAWTRDTVKEWFARGTQPGAKGAVDTDGLLYRRQCGAWRVDPVKAESGPSRWRADVEDWVRRARRGTGVIGQYGSRTAYFWGESSWGGPLVGPCAPKPKPAPEPDEDRGRERGRDRGNGNGDGGGEGGDGGGEGPLPPPDVPLDDPVAPPDGDA